MLYGLLAIALILSLPACGMFRKSEQPAPEATEQMEPMPVEEVDITEEAVVPADDMSVEMPSEDMGDLEK